MNLKNNLPKIKKKLSLFLLLILSMVISFIFDMMLMNEVRGTISSTISNIYKELSIFLFIETTMKEGMKNIYISYLNVSKRNVVYLKYSTLSYFIFVLNGTFFDYAIYTWIVMIYGVVLSSWYISIFNKLNSFYIYPIRNISIYTILIFCVVYYGSDISIIKSVCTANTICVLFYVVNLLLISSDTVLYSNNLRFNNKKNAQAILFSILNTLINQFSRLIERLLIAHYLPLVFPFYFFSFRLLSSIQTLLSGHFATIFLKRNINLDKIAYMKKIHFILVTSVIISMFIYFLISVEFYDFILSNIGLDENVVINSKNILAVMCFALPGLIVLPYIDNLFFKYGKINLLLKLSVVSFFTNSFLFYATVSYIKKPEALTYIFILSVYLRLLYSLTFTKKMG